MPAARTPRPTSKLIPAGSDSQFVFESTVGPISLPSMAASEPTFGIIEAVKALDNVSVMILTAQNSADAPNLALIRKLRFTELNKLYEEWAKFSGISAGE